MKARRLKNTHYIREKVVTATNINGAVTIAAFLKANEFNSPGVGDYLCLFGGHSSGGTGSGYLLWLEGGKVGVYNGAASSISSLTVELNKDVVIGFRKASGTATPVCFRYYPETGEYAEANGHQAIANATAPGTSGTWRINEWQATERGDMELYGVGLWNVAKSKAECEELCKAKFLVEWKTLGTDAKEVWLFDQPSTSLEVKGLIESGSTQSSKEGTEVVESEQAIPPGIHYIGSVIALTNTEKQMEFEKIAASGEGDCYVVLPYTAQGSLKKYTVQQSGGSVGVSQITPDVYSHSYQQGSWLVFHDGTSGKIKVTWEGGESSFYARVVDVYRGVDPENPIDVTGTIEIDAAATTTKWASIKTVHDGAMEYGYVVSGLGTNNEGVPAGFTQRTQFSPHTFERYQASGGTETGEIEVKMAGSSNLKKHHFALKPEEAPKEEEAEPVEVKVEDTAAASDTVSIQKELNKTFSDSALAVETFQHTDEEKETFIETQSLGEEFSIEHIKPIPEGLSAQVVVKEKEPERLYTLVRDPKTNRVVARWADDDPRAPFSIQGEILSDEIPGGWKDLQGTVARDPRQQWFDVKEFNKLEVQNVGRTPLWQGYFDKAGDVSGDYLAMSPSALGPQSKLNDIRARVGFIDSDMRKWGGMSAAREVAIQAISANYSLTAGSQRVGFQDAGSQGPGLIQSFSGYNKEIAADIPIQEFWYWSEGIPIWQFFWSRYINNPGHVGIYQGVGLSVDDITTGYEGANLGAANWPGINAVWTEVPNKFYLLSQLIFNEAALGKMVDISILEYPKVLGWDWRGSGIPLRGVWPNVGLFALECIRRIFELYGDGITTSPYAEDDEFVIPQAWWPDEPQLADIIKDLCKYSATLDWFFYNWDEFDRRRSGTYGRKWKADVSTSKLNETGIDSQRSWRDIVVEWTDVNGRSYTVGPPGSRTDVQSAALEITDPNHPAVRADRVRRDKLVIQGFANATEAIYLGQLFLAEANELSRSGSATLPAYVMDAAGVLWPSSRVKSGDHISFYNARDKGYRKITKKRFKVDEKQAEIDLDAPPSGLEALLERLQVGLVSRGIF